LLRAQQPDAPFLFDTHRACDPCDFIEKLPHVEGTWKNSAGEEQAEIELHPSDIFFLVQLFGFRTPEGTRRFTTAIKAIARKNAKSTLAAAIGLYCETCEDEVGPQVVSAATTGAQARIVFEIARKMVNKTLDLRQAFGVEAFANSIACYANGGTFKPINAKASTQDGLNPSTSIIDEVHAHKTHDLVNVIQSAAGARRDPLFLFTTTEGYESPGPWPELRHFMCQLLKGIVEADHVLAVYYTLDEDDESLGTKRDDDFDESAWVKANPLMTVNPILLRELRKASVEAKQMPGKMAEFRTKRLNRRSATATGWISYPHWLKCGGPVDLEYLRPHPCWAGVDLASTRDLVALRLVWVVEGILYTHGWRWVPEAAVAYRTTRGTVPYAGWVEAKHLIQTPGEIADHSKVLAQIIDVSETFDLQGVAYDTWNASQLAVDMAKAKIRAVPFVQGPRSYHPAMKAFEEAYISGNFRHNSDPVLTWCASNLVVRRDDNMNMAPDKRRSFEKIDDMTALLEGLGLLLADQSEDSEEVQLFFA
jgi:phage terminase large subunit-like protein